MVSNSQAKLLSALSVKKFRQKYRKFLVEGEKMVDELCRYAPSQVSALFGIKRWESENEALIRPFLDKFNLVSEAELKKISSLSTPNSVLAIADMSDKPADWSVPLRELCLYLDGIQDPGNMGTILRIADWFGIGALYCSTDTVDVYSPKVVQASMGAAFRIACCEIELAELIAHNPGIPVLGAVLGGEDVFQVKSPKSGLLVIGNEGQGIRAQNLNFLTQRISILRHPDGRAESLNAGVATGIIAAVLKSGA